MISGSEVILPLQQATHLTLHALGVDLASLGLSNGEINALAALSDGHGNTVTELSKRTGTRASTLTGILDRLERRGYLVRELDPEDRRSFRIALTEAGRAEARQVHDAVTSLEARVLSRLRPGQLEGFHAVVAALQEANNAGT